MPLSLGTRLGPYEVIAPLGAGGMGEVYKALDVRLRREVALKVLPAAVSTNEDRLKRFEREARAASALNHPNIVTVYDIGVSGDTSYIAIELVTGKTLTEVIAHGRLSLRRMLEIGTQVAEGLAAAHEAGIIHRDLKPGNIMLSNTGLAKVVDFGLAKVGPAFGATSPSDAETITEVSRGAVLGTVGYMSPEQARGQEVDFRSDQFSLGCVLYEMATGKRPFTGPSPLDVLTAITREDPEPISRSRPEISPPLVWLIERCLAKSRTDRFQSTADLARDLRTLLERHSEVTSSRMSHAPGKIRLWPSLAALALAVVIITIGIRLNRPSPQARSIRLSVLPPPNASFNVSSVSPAPAVISPDGSRIVFGTLDVEGKDPLWIRSLDGNESRALNGTGGATYPFWSADGNSVGFFSEGMLKKIDTRDGVIAALTAAPNGRGGTWNQEGTILFAPDSLSPLLRISSEGGKPVRVTDVGPGEPHLSHRWPSFLPDGRRFLYLVRAPGPNDPSYGVYLGSLDSREARRLLSESSNAIFAAPKLLLFVREGSLFATTFEPGKLERGGMASLIAKDVYFHPYRWNGAFSVSSAGRLVYHAGASANSSNLQWMERGGRSRGTIGTPRDYGGLRLSPSGDRCAVEVHDSRSDSIDIWIQDVTRGSFERFTSMDAPINDSPVWSPDGNSIVFGSFRNGRWNLYRKSTAGVDKEELLLAGGFDTVPTDWSPDSRFILYWSRPTSEGQKRQLWYIGKGEVPKVYVQGGFNVSSGRFSPDGRWVAYCADETGRQDVYVSPFPEPTNRVQVSVAGGTQPVWRGDGQELFYLSPDNRLMAVPMTFSDRAQPGKAERLFETSFRASPTDINVYDVSHRTGLLLANVADPSATWGPLTVVVNWAPTSH